MNEVSSNPKVLKGGVFHKLFQRAFPGYFNFDSLYLWEPFYTPKVNAKLASEQGVAFDLDITPENKMTIIKPAERETKYTKIEYRKFVDYGPDPKETVYAPKIKSKRKPAIQVDDYATIKNVILGSEKSQYPFPGIAKSLPAGKLRDVYTSQKLHDEATALLGNLNLGVDDKEQVFLDYFFAKAKEVTSNNKRAFQKSIRQIDIVRE